MRKQYKPDVMEIVSKINVLVDSSDEPYIRDDSGRFKANIGCFHISSAYGGHQLQRMSSEGGGIRQYTYGYLSWKKLLPKVQQVYINMLEDKAQN